MRIVDVRARAVSVPRLVEFRPKTAHGERDSSEYVVLEVVTDLGATGLGEATVDRGWSGEDAVTTADLLTGRIKALLVDADALDWAGVRRRLSGVLTGRPFLTAALEMACLDLLGKQAGLPVATLIGGVHRERIPTKFVVPARDPQTVVEMARTAAGRGASAIKVKVGIDLDDDLARVSAVRSALPDVTLTVDANEGWSAGEAAAALPELEALGVTALEQPVSRTAWSTMAALRQASTVAIAGDEAIWDSRDLVTAAGHDALDIACLYPGKCTGIRPAVAMADLAVALGVEVSVGSNLELGVGSAAMAHLLVALPRLSDAMPADLIGPLYHEHSLVTDDSFIGFSGARLPAGPGLGVTLDDAAVDHYLLR